MNPSLVLPKFARNKVKTDVQQPVVPESIPPSSPRITTLIVPTRSPATAIINGVTPGRSPARSPATAIINGVTPPRIPIPVRSPTIVNGVTPPRIPIPVRSPIAKGPNSPLYIPRIGIMKEMPNRGPTSPNVLSPEENPWLPPKVEGAGELKITAITPIGTIAMVPTCDKRPPPTPRKLPQTPNRNLTLRVVDEHTGEAKIDPLLTATIYLDCTKPEDRNYDYVAQRMRVITETTAGLQHQYSTQFRTLINVSGRVSQRMFEDVLAIYENNQVYYQDRIDDQAIPIQSIKDGLNALEQWFGCIIEPKPRDTDELEAWHDREMKKLTKGVTAYCDPELYKYIIPFNETLRAHIKQLQN